MKTKETNPTRPGSPTPCKQALRHRGDKGFTQQFRFSFFSSVNSISHYSIQNGHNSVINVFQIFNILIYYVKVIVIYTLLKHFPVLADWKDLANVKEQYTIYLRINTWSNLVCQEFSPEMSKLSFRINSIQSIFIGHVTLAKLGFIHAYI